MRWDEIDTLPCSMARALSVVGDRWTMLIIRDCFLGVRRFDEFERRLGITRHILSDRLKKLVEQEVLYKAPYQDRPVRVEYRLTEKGLELHPIVLGLVHWGDKHMADERGAPIVHIHKECGNRMTPVTTCSCCGKPVSARDVCCEVGKKWRQDLTDLVPE